MAVLQRGFAAIIEKARRSNSKGNSILQRHILLGGLWLSAAFSGWAQDAPDQIERIQETHYVRRFSAGVTGGLSVLNQTTKLEDSLFVDSNPPVLFLTQADPQNDRIGFGITAQFTISDRWAVAINPSYRKINFTGFTRRLDGVDNSSTAIDERALTRINDETTARYLDLPILLRRYNKDHIDPGTRFFWDFGATYRRVSNVRTERKIDPPNEDPFFVYEPLDHKSSVFGGVIGMGIQFIDDFGIRATPEVRYTYWVQKPFDSIYGRSRNHQIEVLITLGF